MEPAVAITPSSTGPNESGSFWHGIRPEYFKVWSDFPATAAPFKIRLSESQLHSLGHMLAAMDLIDSTIDREPSQHNRADFCRAIIAWMREDGVCSNGSGHQLSNQIQLDRLVELRDLIHVKQIARPLLSAAERVFCASEQKRNAATARGLIRNLIDEGQAAAEMTILLLGDNTNEQFNNFLQRIMRIGTIVDTLLDADDDFKSGLLQLKPTRLFRWRLKSAIARQLPQLILGFPDRRLLWRYCLSYTRET